MVELVKWLEKVSGLITRHMSSALEIRFPVLTLSSGADQRISGADQSLDRPDICLRFTLNEPLRCLTSGRSGHVDAGSVLAI